MKIDYFIQKEITNIAVYSFMLNIIVYS